MNRETLDTVAIVIMFAVGLGNIALRIMLYRLAIARWKRVHAGGQQRRQLL